jgi:hypothetical protein
MGRTRPERAKSTMDRMRASHKSRSSRRALAGVATALLAICPFIEAASAARARPKPRAPDAGVCTESCDRKASDCVDGCEVTFKEAKPRVECKLDCANERQKCEADCKAKPE